MPTTGTSAHAFTLVHDDERAAFVAQLEALGPDTTLLVDTYHVEPAVRLAVLAAGPNLGAVRIDSGDLVQTSLEVRRLLDELGAHSTRIVATSDLDEHAIAALRGGPVDAFGVGTSVVTGSGAPAAGFVYKLVARSRTPGGPMEPVAKASPGKAGHGGAKSGARRFVDGRATAEVVYPRGATSRPDERELTVPLVRRGEVVAVRTLEDIRAHHRAAMAELPSDVCRMSAGDPVIPTLYAEVSS